MKVKDITWELGSLVLVERIALAANGDSERSGSESESSSSKSSRGEFN